MGTDGLISKPIMKLRHVFVCGVAGSLLAGGMLFAADSNAPSPAATTAAVYVPDTSHQNDPLPDGVLAWNGLTQEATVAASLPSERMRTTPSLESWKSCW